MISPPQCHKPYNWGPRRIPVSAEGLLNSFQLLRKCSQPLIILCELVVPVAEKRLWGCHRGRQQPCHLCLKGAVSLPEHKKLKLAAQWEHHSQELSSLGAPLRPVKVSYFPSLFISHGVNTVTGKCCTPYARKFGKLSSGHRTGKGQFSFQSQRKAMPKNVQTTTQLHSSHMLVK